MTRIDFHRFVESTFVKDPDSYIPLRMFKGLVGYEEAKNGHIPNQLSDERLCICLLFNWGVDIVWDELRSWTPIPTEQVTMQGDWIVGWRLADPEKSCDDIRALAHLNDCMYGYLARTEVPRRRRR